jgi:hypothetical protein
MTQVKRYRRGKAISGKEVLQAQKILATEMKADVLIPGKNNFVERSVIVLTLIFLAVLIGWFSYQKGVGDQIPIIDTDGYNRGLKEGATQGQSEARKEGWDTGMKDGRRVQQRDDLIVCQAHSNVKRLEKHCVAEVE